MKSQILKNMQLSANLSLSYVSSYCGLGESYIYIYMFLFLDKLGSIFTEFFLSFLLFFLSHSLGAYHYEYFGQLTTNVIAN